MTGTDRQNQDAIWRHFQAGSAASFQGAEARLSHLARHVGQGTRVLNVGVGNGRFEELAAARGGIVHVLDPDEDAVARVREHLNLGDRAQAGRMDALPFPDTGLDLVVASEVLEHLSDGILEAALAEAARVLRPGGSLLVTVPAEEVLDEHVVVCPSCEHRFHRWGHEQSFDEARLRKVLEPHFAIASIARRRFFSFRTLNWKGKLHAALLTALTAVGIHGAGESLLCVARTKDGTTSGG